MSFTIQWINHRFSTDGEITLPLKMSTALPQSLIGYFSEASQVKCMFLAQQPISTRISTTNPCYKAYRSYSMINENYTWVSNTRANHVDKLPRNKVYFRDCMCPFISNYPSTMIKSWYWKSLATTNTKSHKLPLCVFTTMVILFLSSCQFSFSILWGNKDLPALYY